MLDAATDTQSTSNSERAMITDRLLDAAGISVDRLPMLPVVFDRMARLMADVMRQKSPSPSYISVSYVENNRIGDVLDEFESNALVAVLYSPEWDARVLVGFDRDFIFTLVDVLFGADGTEPPIDEERPFSNIETRIARTIFEIAAKSLAESFAPIAETTLKIERIESRMDFAVVGRTQQPGGRWTPAPAGHRPRWRSLRRTAACDPQSAAPGPVPSVVRRNVRPRQTMDAALPQRNPADGSQAGSDPGRTRDAPRRVVKPEGRPSD
jgi:hypothetical protein